jgi:hypothetical protein
MRNDIRKAFEPTQTGVPPRFSTVASSCSNEAIFLAEHFLSDGRSGTLDYVPKKLEG